MKTDFYTKLVLTIIALCLTILTLQNIEIIPKAYASGPNNTMIPSKNYAQVPLNADGSIDVNIKSINTSDELDVNIDEVGGSSVYRSIPVKNE